MKTVTYQEYQRVRKWIYRYARHLDITRWQYHFESGSKKEVMEALLFYQNADGGFGHALEFDCWNPNSQPVSSFFAWNILKEIGCDKKENPIIKGILRYLEQGDCYSEQGCLWSIPSNNQYPANPWYLYPNAPWFPADWPPQNYTNSDFISFVLKYANKNSKIYKDVFAIIVNRLSRMDKLSEFFTFAKSDIEQDIEAKDWIQLIACLQEYQIKTQEECDVLYEKLMKLLEAGANESVYEACKRKRLQEDYSDEELDKKVDWIVHGIWSKNGLYCEDPVVKIKEMAPVGELWWPIHSAIETLRVLKEHNRLD